MSADGSPTPWTPTLLAGEKGVFQAVFAALPHPVLLADAGGTILFANLSASAIFGGETDDLAGRPLSSLFLDVPAFAPTEPIAEFWKRIEAEPVNEARALSGIRQGEVMVAVEIGIRVLVEGSSRYLVVSLDDATARLTLEAQLAAAGDEERDFKRLVTSLANRYGEAEPSLVNETMADSLRQLGEALQLDQLVVWQWRSDSADVIPLHAWPGRVEPFAAASVPHITEKVQRHEACWFATPAEIPNPADRRVFQERGILASAVIPMGPFAADGSDVRALVFSSQTAEVRWSPLLIQRLRLATSILGQALAGAQAAEALQRALTEVRTLRERVDRPPPRRESSTAHPSIIVAESPSMKAVMAQIAQVTPTGATVLLLGETGTGKEVMAQAIHDHSPRHARPMVRVSCAAIPTALIESELFGRERGAYTGALSRQIGRFEAANQSTLFLDEIGELPADVQVKLLRVLEERVIERLGSTQPVKVDVRIIAATNRDLEKAVEEKNFREDLFYRLNVFPILVPPLRERPEDIPGLVWAFIDEFSKSFGKNITSISKESMHDLLRYAWPGNVRELRNVIERAVILSVAPELVVAAPRPPARMPQNAMTLSALEIEHIRTVLESTHWRVRGKGGAAERLGLKPTTLESRMAKFGIVRHKTI